MMAASILLNADKELIDEVFFQMDSLAVALSLLSACSAKPTKQVPAEFQKGQAQFHKVCANCHGPDALGEKPKHPA